MVTTKKQRMVTDRRRRSKSIERKRVAAYCRVSTDSEEYDRQLFEEALSATSKHRGSVESIADRARIIERISESNDLQNMWKKYQQRFTYAGGIEYADILKALRELLL